MNSAIRDLVRRFFFGVEATEHDRLVAQTRIAPQKMKNFAPLPPKNPLVSLDQWAGYQSHYNEDCSTIDYSPRYHTASVR